MGLRDIVLPRARVQASDSSEFEVRGLSPADALGLYQRHGGALSKLFDEFAGKADIGAAVEAIDVAGALISGAPRIMAEIIAIAAGEDPRADDWEDVVTAVLAFPAGLQVSALEKIGELTFTSEMPAKKFAGLVVALARSAQAGPIPKT